MLKYGVALTGGIGSGKSTVSSLLNLYGYSTICADKISHDVLELSKDRVMDVFGSEILDSARNIGRKKLGEIVFQNREKLEVLEKILHPLVESKIVSESEKLESKKVLYFIDIPLFFEKNLAEKFGIKHTLLIYAPKEKQIERVKNRDGLNEREVINILDSQMDIERKRELSEFVIENCGTLKDLQKSVESFLDKLPNFIKQD